MTVPQSSDLRYLAEDLTMAPLFQEELATSPAPAPIKKSRQYQIPAYRISLVREETVRVAQPQVRTSANAADIFRAYLGDDADREHCMTLMLDTKNKVIGINTVSIGSLTASVVHPRESFKGAILANAYAIILGHNHPSGDSAPSQADRDLTRKLVEASKILDIPLLDHIVLGDGTTNYYSFADNGAMG